jgi:hypothetical protein
VRILQGQRRICVAMVDSASAVTRRTGRIGSHSRYRRPAATMRRSMVAR